jgi:hypothetical protein
MGAGGSFSPLGCISCTVSHYPNILYELPYNAIRSLMLEDASPPHRLFGNIGNDIGLCEIAALE